MKILKYVRHFIGSQLFMTLFLSLSIGLISIMPNLWQKPWWVCCYVCSILTHWFCGYIEHEKSIVDKHFESTTQQQKIEFLETRIKILEDFSFKLSEQTINITKHNTALVDWIIKKMTEEVTNENE